MRSERTFWVKHPGLGEHDPKGKCQYDGRPCVRCGDAVLFSKDQEMWVAWEGERGEAVVRYVACGRCGPVYAALMALGA